KGLVFRLGKLHTFVAETNQFVAAKRAQVAFFVKKTRFKMLNHPLRKPCLRVVFRAFKLAQESGKSAFGSRVEALGVGHVNDLKALDGKPQGCILAKVGFKSRKGHRTFIHKAEIGCRARFGGAALGQEDRELVHKIASRCRWRFEREIALVGERSEE